MRRFKLILILLMVFFLIPRSPAYSAETLTLDQVLASVDQHFPLIQSAQIEVQKSEAEHQSAQGGFDPVLHTTFASELEGHYKNTYTDVGIEQPTGLWGTRLFTGYRNGQGNFPIYDAQYATFTGGELRGGVEIPILKGGPIDERRLRIKTTEAGMGIAQKSLELQKLETHKFAAFRYWDWVAAGKKLETAKELLEISLVRDNALVHRVKHGDSAQVEQTDNQRAVTQRQAAVISAERTLQKTALELSIYYRDSSGNPSVASSDLLPSKFPEPSTQLVGEPGAHPSGPEDVASHPEIQRIQLQTQQVEYEYSFATNQVLPKLDLNLGVYSDFGMNPGTSFLPASTYPAEFRMSVTLEFPIFFRTARGKARSTEASLNKIQAHQRLTADRIRMIRQDSSQAMTNAIQRLEFARKEIALGRKLEEAERVRFQHGDSHVLMINIREQITRDAFIKEFDALADYYKAQAELKAAKGVIHP